MKALLKILLNNLFYEILDRNTPFALIDTLFEYMVMFCFTNDISSKMKSFWEEKFPSYHECFCSSAKHKRSLFTVTFNLKYLYEYSICVSLVIHECF